MIVLGYVITGLAIIALTLMPGWGAAPYILASTVIHWAYYYF